MGHRVGERPLEELFFGRALQFGFPQEMPSQVLERRVEARDLRGQVRQWVRSIPASLEERTRVPQDAVMWRTSSFGVRTRLPASYEPNDSGAPLSAFCVR